jgi:hypothetical protein
METMRKSNREFDGIENKGGKLVVAALWGQGPSLTSSKAPKP